MESGVRKGFRFLWYLAYPLLVYEVIYELPVFVLASAEGGRLQREAGLPILGLASALTAAVLGWQYRKLGLGMPRSGWERTRQTAEQARKALGGTRQTPERTSLALDQTGQAPGRASDWEGGLAKAGSWIFWSVLVGMGACLCFNHGLMLFPLPGQEQALREIGEVLYTPPLWMQVLCTGLLTPLAEELMFRGMGYARLRRELPVWPAALITAVWFGIFHGTLYQGVYVALTGFLLALVYEWTGRLSAAWAAHGAAKVLAVGLTAAAAEDWVGTRPVLAGAIALAGAAIAALGLWRLKTESEAGA